MNTYDMKDTVRLTVEFRDGNDALADAGSGSLSITNGNDETVTVVQLADLQHLSTGVYAYDVLLDLEGRWWYRFEGLVGGLALAEEAVLLVRDSQFYSPIGV